MRGLFAWLWNIFCERNCIPAYHIYSLSMIFNDTAESFKSPWHPMHLNLLDSRMCGMVQGGPISTHVYKCCKDRVKMNFHRPSNRSMIRKDDDEEWRYGNAHTAQLWLLIVRNNKMVGTRIESQTDISRHEQRSFSQSIKHRVVLKFNSWGISMACL